MYKCYIYISQNKGLKINKIFREIKNLHNYKKFITEEQINRTFHVLYLPIMNSKAQLDYNIY